MHTHSDVLTSERTDLARSERVVYLKPNPLFFPSAVMMLRKTQHRIETASKKLTIDRENARRVSLCVPPPSSLLRSSVLSPRLSRRRQKWREGEDHQDTITARFPTKMPCSAVRLASKG